LSNEIQRDEIMRAYISVKLKQKKLCRVISNDHDLYLWNKTNVGVIKMIGNSLGQYFLSNSVLDLKYLITLHRVTLLQEQNKLS
jgi:hypothetical protein